MDAVFKEHVDAVIEKFTHLPGATTYPIGNVDKTLLRESGVYVLAENGTDCYVGRARTFGQRMKNHLSDDPTQASLAVKIARESLRRSASYKKGQKFSDQLTNDPEVQRAFQAARQRIQNMTMRALIEHIPVRQALLEIYAAEVLKTKYNSWKTS